MVLTDWLSITPALGLASRPLASRRASRPLASRSRISKS